MIMQWKKVSSTEYQMRWNGRFLSLMWEGDCWRLYITGPDGNCMLVRDRWATPLAAQNAVDNVQQRIVTQLMAKREEAPSGDTIN